MAFTASDVERIHKAGRIASLIGLEGGHSIEDSLDNLRDFYTSGARYMTLACSESNNLADAAMGVPLHNGLSPLGERVVREMNHLGMLVDLSHTSEETMNDVLDISKAPVIFSHSSMRAICNTPRNVSDEVLERLKKNNGIVMITFATMYITEESYDIFKKKMSEWKRLEMKFPDNQQKVREEINAWQNDHPWPPVTLSDIADHFDYAREVVGIDHMGIGSDFGGFRSTPVGLEDVSKFPCLLAELLHRGYTPDEIRKIAGENILRVMRKSEEIRHYK
jgi:membrane dipeptidase